MFGSSGIPPLLIRSGPFLFLLFTSPSNLKLLLACSIIRINLMLPEIIGDFIMYKQIALEFPEEILSTLKEDPKSFAKELKLAAAVKWYEVGKLSQEKAAMLAGLSRKEFIESLIRFKVSPVQYDVDEIREELSRA